MKKSLMALSSIAGLVFCSYAFSDITVISQGGANMEAQKKAFYETYQKLTGSKIIAGEFNGEMAKIKVMVDTGSVSWDVVELELPELARACDEGLLEELNWDPAIFGAKDNVIKGAIQPCGVGFFVWSTIIAYNEAVVKVAPTGWADFWDVQKIPGKRGLRKGAKYTLEFALMADGVAPNDVYKVLATKEGQDRAFKKLDQIKPYIQWWEAGAQPPQYLQSGDVVMSTAYNGRIAAVQADSKLKIVWNGGIYDMDAWAIPKGAKNKAEGLKFIAHTLKPESQKLYAENIPYGPVNSVAISLLAPERLDTLPTAPEHLKGQIRIDFSFWSDYGEQLEQRFNAWAAK